MLCADVRQPYFVYQTRSVRPIWYICVATAHPSLGCWTFSLVSISTEHYLELMCATFIMLWIAVITLRLKRNWFTSRFIQYFTIYLQSLTRDTCSRSTYIGMFDAPSLNLSNTFSNAYIHLLIAYYLFKLAFSVSHVWILWKILKVRIFENARLYFSFVNQGKFPEFQLKYSILQKLSVHSLRA